MLWIRDILVQIWIRIRGSLPLTNRSESCYFRSWPSRRQQKRISFLSFSTFYFLKLHLHNFSKIKKNIRIRISNTDLHWTTVSLLNPCQNQSNLSRQKKGALYLKPRRTVMPNQTNNLPNHTSSVRPDRLIPTLFNFRYHWNVWSIRYRTPVNGVQSSPVPVPLPTL